jgi:hypothetical protein
VWKGLAITPAAGFNGTVVGFNRSANSQVVVYYHTPATGTPPKKLRTYRLFFNSPRGTVDEPRYFTNIRYDLSGANTPFRILHNNKTEQVLASASNNITYAQAGTGLATKLVIPGLETLRTRQRQENLIINRAELIVPVQRGSTAQFAAPAALYIYEAAANNRVLKFSDNGTPTERIVQADNANPRGSGVAATLRQREENGPYSTLITNYVQAYASSQLSGSAPGALLLSPSLRTADQLTLDRAAIDASNIRLRVYYSKPAQ